MKWATRLFAHLFSCTDARVNKQGQKLGPKRGSRQRFPYEPRVVCGRLLMLAELQAIHRYVLETPVLEEVTEEIRGSRGDRLA
jgi:hypothetical protein